MIPKETTFGLRNPDFSLLILRFLSSETKTKIITLFASSESVASVSAYRVMSEGLQFLEWSKFRVTAIDSRQYLDTHFMGAVSTTFLRLYYP